MKLNPTQFATTELHAHELQAINGGNIFFDICVMVAAAFVMWANGWNFDNGITIG